MVKYTQKWFNLHHWCPCTMKRGLRVWTTSLGHLKPSKEETCIFYNLTVQFVILIIGLWHLVHEKILYWLITDMTDIKCGLLTLKKQNTVCQVESRWCLCELLIKYRSHRYSKTNSSERQRKVGVSLSYPISWLELILKLLDASDLLRIKSLHKILLRAN